MEWLVKKTCCSAAKNRHVLVLSDTSGALKMIAEVCNDVIVQPGDLLSPLQDAMYCINRDTQRTIKVIDARSYSGEEWEDVRKTARNRQ
ncbi:signal transduction protein PmrD [Escherichia coli]|nr:signal transduction protein PmrD [Escherichia coli]